METFKQFIIVLFITFSALTSITYAESLKFDASTYEGEVKKGKAHGVGIFTFSDGSIYEGKVKSNKIHGKGKFTDAKGKVYEGKFKYGAFIIKIDNKTREFIKLKAKTGLEIGAEIKGTGTASGKWFAAEKNSSGIYKLTAKGKREMDTAISVAASGSDSSSDTGGSGC